VSSTTRALPRSESATTRISTSRRGKKQRNATSSRNLLVVAQRSADDASETQSPEKKKNSRRAFLNTCACAFCFASSTNAPARAFPKLVEVNESVIQDVLDHRNQQTDKVFAKAMTTMAGYERVIEPRKTKLFTKAFSDRTGKIDVVELGAGTWPNAKYYDMVALKNPDVEVDVYGVDPNKYMTSYALENFEKVKSEKLKYEPLRGVSENLPFEDGSVDVAVVSLVLCSVEDQLASLKEVKRILRPKTGKFIFVEHVLSQTNDNLRRQQEVLTPVQMKAADGCRLNRKTGEVITNVFGSDNVDMEYFDLDGFWVIGSQIAGIASV